MLEGKIVKLVNFEEKHLTQEYECWLNDPEINKYLCTGRFPFYLSNYKIKVDEKNIKFAIINKEDQKYIGTISLHDINIVDNKGEIGYLIDKNYWGRGIASEVVGLVSDYALMRINLHKVFACTVQGNVGSEKALLKNGFKHCATIPQDYFLDGKYLDLNMFYKLQEWVK